MNHVSDERFLELSLGLSLTMAEDAHVGACPACGARWAEENELSSLLGNALPASCAAPLVPASQFVMQTVTRYERVRATRDAVRIGVVFAMAMMVGAVASVLGSMVLAPRIPHLLGNVLHAGIVAAKLANAGTVLVANAPFLAAAMVMLATMGVALWSALLLRLYARSTRSPMTHATK